MTTTIDIIVLSAVVSGAVSIITNVISYYMKKWIDNREKKREDRVKWDREVVSICKRVRTKAIEIEYNVPIDPLDKDLPSEQEDELKPEIELLSSLISDLELKLEAAPQHSRNSPIVETGQELIDYYKAPPGDERQFTTTDLKKGIISRAEETMDQIYEQSSAMDTRPY